MSRESALMAGRQAAAEAFQDTATFYRKTGRTARNATTGREAPVETLLFSSPCKVRAGSTAALVPLAQEREVAGRAMTTLRAVLHLPVTAPALKPDDFVVISAIGPYSDAQLLNRRFQIVSPLAQSYGTARRFAIEEVVA